MLAALLVVLGTAPDVGAATGGTASYPPPPAPLTFLPITPLGARCLDSSPYGFYFVPAKGGAASSTKWTLYLQGGGWCTTEASCWSRAHIATGTSSLFPRTSRCRCMNGPGVDDQTCNCLYLPYCDGASFSGFREAPWPVNATNPHGDKLYFRGLANLDDTLAHAFTHLGLGNATEMVVTGESAGGLATFVHADRVAERMGARVRTTAAPIVGFFLDHAPSPSSDPAGGPSPSGYPATPIITWMAYMYRMMNMTARGTTGGQGGGGALNAECMAAFPATPHFCFMSPHLAPYIRTPLFMFNSKVDEWQLMNDLQVPCYRNKTNYPNHTIQCPAEQQAEVFAYASDFTAALAPLLANPANGAFITSCICHSCAWNQLSLGNRTGYAHYTDWITGKTTGPASVHIDSRAPNGGGALPPMSPVCFPWP